MSAQPKFNKEKKGVWIPDYINQSTLLNSDEKLILAMVLGFVNTGEFTASNQYISDRLGLSERKIQRTLKDLECKGIIYRKLFKIDQFKQRRVIEINRENSVFSGTSNLTCRRGENVDSSDLSGTSNLVPRHVKSDTHGTSNLTPNNKAIYNKAIVNTNVFTLTDSDESAKLKKYDNHEIDFFEKCWLEYERYGTKKQALKYWKKLSSEDRKIIFKKIPEYVKSTPGKKYRMYFEGWINPANKKFTRPVRTESPGGSNRVTFEEKIDRVKRDLDNLGITQDDILF